MRNPRRLRRLLAASVLAVPVGVIWAYCGLAEWDRADCGAVLHSLFVTSGVGLLLAGFGMLGICGSLIALAVARFRR